MRITKRMIEGVQEHLSKEVVRREQDMKSRGKTAYLYNHDYELGIVTGIELARKVLGRMTGDEKMYRSDEWLNREV